MDFEQNVAAPPPPQRPMMRPRPKPATGFSLASNQFGFDLLNQIGQQQQKAGQTSNIFFSPYGIAVALSMVHQGANGETQKQLAKALRYDNGVIVDGSGQEKIQVAQAIQKTVHDIKESTSDETSSSTSSFQYGNLMVADQGFKIKDDYIKAVQQYYDGELMSADFRNKGAEAQQKINQFVANKTNGMIDQMLDQPPSPDTKLALINAVYFKGQWSEKFQADSTKNDVFYGYGGKKYENVPFMFNKAKYPHGELDGLQASMVMIPYGMEDVAMVAILPHNRDADLQQLRRQLNATYVDEKIARLHRNPEAELYFPKFEMKTQYDLPEALRALGVEDVFTDRSDLTGIGNDEEKLAISKAIHKARIIVNEEGTEAGAGTYIEIMLMAAPVQMPTPVFRFDHPFLYFIRHQSTGQILFLGEVNQF